MISRGALGLGLRVWTRAASRLPMQVGMTLKRQFEQIVGIRDRNCRGTAIQLAFSMLAMLVMMQALAETAAQTLSNDPLGELPVSASLCTDMKLRNVLHSKAPVGCDRLKLIR